MHKCSPGKLTGISQVKGKEEENILDRVCVLSPRRRREGSSFRSWEIVWLDHGEVGVRTQSDSMFRSIGGKEIDSNSILVKIKTGQK